MVTINTAGVAAGFNPVNEEGWYDAVLTGYKEVAESKSSGQPTGTMEFTIEDPREDGHKCWRNYSLQPKALMYIKGAMVQLGQDPATMEGDWDTEELIPGLFGSKCKILVKHKEYEGATQDNVSQVRARDNALVAGGSKGKKGGGW